MLLLATGCGQQPVERPAAEDVKRRAVELAHETLIFDTHIDLPYRLYREQVDLTERTGTGHIDGPRAREGGLDAAFMAVYVPPRLHGTPRATELADELIDLVEDLERRWPDWFTVAHSPGDVREAFAEGTIALPLGIENGSAIGEDLDLLDHFHERGVRYITLAHGENNQICDSSYADEPTWGGLSPFGREVVARMNRLGIMVDVSHVTDAAFWDVLEVASVPPIASHSSCRAFTPGWERNMSDEMIVALAEAGGVIQIAFGSSFLSKEANERSSAVWGAYGRYLREHDLSGDSEEAQKYRAQLIEENPPVPVTVAQLVDHIDHVVELVGVDHVGFGSDFDGVSELPEGLGDVSGYPNVIAELLRRGYSEADIRKICGENILRVWENVETAAAELERLELKVAS